MTHCSTETDHGAHIAWALLMQARPIPSAILALGTYHPEHLLP